MKEAALFHDHNSRPVLGGRFWTGMAWAILPAVALWALILFPIFR